MEFLLDVDWRALFVPSGSLVEIVIRGVLTYLVLFGVLRIMRREAGAIGVSDLLVVVLIADAIQNGMAGNYRSITEGVVLVVTIALSDYVLDWLGYHVPAVQRMLRPPPLPLVERGTINRRNLRSEMITIDELEGLLREQGVDDIAEVRRCSLEGDGRISVITYREDEKPRSDPQDDRRHA